MTAAKRFPDRDHAADVREQADRLEPGTVDTARVRIAGRVMGRRVAGKELMFLDLVDRSGRIQVLAQPSRFGDVSLGDIVGVEGVLTKTKRGEPSVTAEAFEVLAPIRTSLPDTFHGLTDIEQRYRKRYLDLLMNEEVRADFILRARIVTAVRSYLDGEGFVEVETPILQPRYGGAFAEPFVTHHNVLDQDLYLRIATELYLKRLIVGGLEKVYEIGKDFRNEGVNYKRNPEFTMLEWYEAYADYQDTMRRMESLVEHVAQTTLGTTKVVFKEQEIDLKAPWKRVRLVDELKELDLWTRDYDDLKRRLEEREIDVSQDKTWSQLVDKAVTSYIEPRLIEPTILYDYPIELSPFARTSDDDPAIVERFEFYVGGMELGNAFTELNDAEEQASRFAMQADEGAGGNVEAEQGDPDYVEALSYGMPPTGGLGLGIDRLAMVLLGRDSIRDVILFPALRTRD
jgi:lysyl-tRNA synthetase, class II